LFAEGGGEVAGFLGFGISADANFALARRRGGEKREKKKLIPRFDAEDPLKRMSIERESFRRGRRKEKGKSTRSASSKLVASAEMAEQIRRMRKKEETGGPWNSFHSTVVAGLENGRRGRGG